jgi:hypothetical protein
MTEASAANSALIIAAPELLKVCKDARDAIASLPEEALGIAYDTRDHWPIRDELLHNLDEAIKKATGESDGKVSQNSNGVQERPREQVQDLA